MHKAFKYCIFFITFMQTEAFLFSNRAFTYYNDIKLKGEFSSKEEIEEFHKKFSHIGYYPFTIIPSIYYDMNYVYFENGIPKVYTNIKYINTMQKLLNEGVKKHCE